MRFLGEIGREWHKDGVASGAHPLMMYAGPH